MDSDFHSDWVGIKIGGSLPNLDPIGHTNTPWDIDGDHIGYTIAKVEEVNIGDTNSGGGEYTDQTPEVEYSVPTLDTGGNFGYPGNHDSNEDGLNDYGASQGAAQEQDSQSIYGYVTGVSFSDDYSTATMTLNTGEQVTIDTTQAKGEGDSVTYGEMATYSDTESSSHNDSSATNAESK